MQQDLRIGPIQAGDLRGFIPAPCEVCETLITPATDWPVIIVEEYETWAMRRQGISLPVVFHVRCLKNYGERGERLGDAIQKRLDNQTQTGGPTRGNH